MKWRLLFSQNKYKRNLIVFLGLATGGSPVGMYKELVARHQAGHLSFKEVQTLTWMSMLALSNQVQQATLHLCMRIYLICGYTAEKCPFAKWTGKLI